MAYIPLVKSGKALLVDLINTSNGSQHAPSQLTFSNLENNPVDQPPGSDYYNTKITVEAVPGSGYSGAVDVWYTRLFIQGFFEAADFDAGGDGFIRITPDDAGTGMTLPEALTNLEAQYGIYIDKSDFDSTTVAPVANDRMEFELPTDMYIWAPGFLTIKIEEEYIDVNDVFPPELNGFEEPDPIIT